jgi:acetyltransferase-like isoleucine patch superfamily enzyme
MTFLFRLCVVLLPWPLRRHVLRLVYGYAIHPTARIGLSWVFPEKLVMAEHAHIGHLNVAIRLHRIELESHALIHRSNWITGVPRGDPRHFQHLPGRDPALVMRAHSAITKHHHIDCTDRIEIGAFATVAGYGSQFLTHAIDLIASRQNAAPILIGDYCFVGTDVVILGGASLPERSVLGAKALLNKAHAEPGWLYAGVPATPVKALPADAAYFRRTTGFVT